jgi:hypothetical protein
MLKRELRSGIFKYIVMEKREIYKWIQAKEKGNKQMGQR